MDTKNKSVAIGQLTLFSGFILLGLNYFLFNGNIAVTILICILFGVSIYYNTRTLAITKEEFKDKK